MTAERWLAPRSCVRLRIWLGDAAFDYAATAVAARNLIHDCTRKRWCAIELIPATAEECLELPRLPYEQLFFGP
ncbi:hypothetical protein [Nocardia gamkensis]|uniref:hypothetical protein n=1 Tax=Nocardia gamkensis TaxID=352869 RepID=UPI0037CAAF89